MQRTTSFLYGVLLSFAGAPMITACGDDGGGSGDDGATGDDGGTADDGGTDGTDGGTGTGTATGTGGGTCPGISGEATAEEGDSCTSNDECTSGVCVLFQDVPTPEDAVCGAMTEDCATRITGTVFSFPDKQPVADENVKVAAALNAATDPSGAPALAEATSNTEGQIDVTTDMALSAAIGIVGIAGGGGGDYSLTATGIASPVDGQSYAPGASIHELWVVANSTLSDWSTELESDADVADFLPLGEMGGVVGLVRDGTTGDPVSGAAVVPADPDSSEAVVRYLNDDGSFNADATTTTGVFVLVNPGLAEEFNVEKDGTQINSVPGTAGSAPGAAFTLIVNVEGG